MEQLDKELDEVIAQIRQDAFEVSHDKITIGVYESRSNLRRAQIKQVFFDNGFKTHEEFLARYDIKTGQRK